MIKNTLKLILAERDISINKLSKDTGIRYGTLYAFIKRQPVKIEEPKSKNKKKERPPSINLEVIDKVCEVLNLTPGDFIIYVPNKEKE